MAYRPTRVFESARSRISSGGSPRPTPCGQTVCPGFATDQADALDEVSDPERHHLVHQLHPKLTLDLDYLRHRSLRRDVDILVRTLAALTCP